MSCSPACMPPGSLRCAALAASMCVRCAMPHQGCRAERSARPAATTATMQGLATAILDSVTRQATCSLQQALAMRCVCLLTHGRPCLHTRPAVCSHGVPCACGAQCSAGCHHCNDAGSGKCDDGACEAGYWLTNSQTCALVSLHRVGNGRNLHGLRACVPWVSQQSRHAVHERRAATSDING